jgi:predicted RNA-binding Zn-ribbon protein involved in translation (DUF1610 family)
MEIITERNSKLKEIFKDHWDAFKDKYAYKGIRESINKNVEKMLKCGTKEMGYHQFVCDKCGTKLRVYHSCKSHFCPSCGKKLTEQWIKNIYKTLPKTKYQHITFTMPNDIWELCWMNRHLMNTFPKIAAHIIIDLANKKGFLPGIFVAIHTFGRALGKNYHIHLSTTVGGISIDNKKYINYAFYKSINIMKMWRYRVIRMLRKEYHKGNIKTPKNWKINTKKDFHILTQKWYDKHWVIFLAAKTDSMKRNVEYLGRYIKRPPIGETRIIDYNGNTVTFKYLDHNDTQTKELSLPVMDFIKRVIIHIMDDNFKRIRYYGFLANRVKGKYLQLVFKLLNIAFEETKMILIHWRTMYYKTFHYDPLICTVCNLEMRIELIALPPPYNTKIYF